MLLHVILPVMFAVHWIVFCEHPVLKWYHPLFSCIMPAVYVVFIVIRAHLLPSTSNAIRYPYFFLNISNLGWGGFWAWMGALLTFFTAFGYLLYLLDRFVLAKKAQAK